MRVLFPFSSLFRGPEGALQCFFRSYTHYFLRKHIDATYRVEVALLDVQEAIARRRNIPQSHIDVREGDWQWKLQLRLSSFGRCVYFFCEVMLDSTLNEHRTVERLTSMRDFVEARRKFSQKQLDMLLQKLLAHETKYVDISTKLHVCQFPQYMAHAYSHFLGFL